MDGTDWRKILMAYICHVVEEDGTDHLDRLPGPALRDLDGEELAALYDAAAETPCADEHRLELRAFARQVRGVG